MEHHTPQKFTSVILAIFFIIFFSTHSLIHASHPSGNLQITASSGIKIWLDGVFIGSLKVILLRNIMIISGILFFIVEIILLQGNNDNLWVSFLVFFTARSMLLGIALHYHMKNNRFITI